MPLQNLVSATLSEETKTEILQVLAEIKTKLDFLRVLQPDDVKSVMKAGNDLTSFIEKAYLAVNAHPEIMSDVIDINEFKKDYALSKELTPIANYINELAGSIQNTLMAVNSDALVASLEVYAAIEQNCDKVPGLNIVADKMAQFYPRTAQKSVSSHAHTMD